MAQIKLSDIEAIVKILSSDAVLAAAKMELGEDVEGLSVRVREALDGIATPAVRRAAQDLYESDDIEIDEDAGTSESDHGIWVQAWVHVHFPDCEVCDGLGENDVGEHCPECGGSGKGTI